ncbi:hypothetical protein ACVRY7_10565 [Streptococcus ictaluri]|uniref:Glutaredoxin domain-containing protein n=1 Tax=Streptococcus ictaluri 707-05 TaxID=764299 RepID=G5K4T3_9STRE|nr:hypothetical protein [Streptococcus ictaluri]EHI68787.1 hypothetical protein STRIC_1820 [Streptococcus ictaluri 707-05]
MNIKSKWLLLFSLLVISVGLFILDNRSYLTQKDYRDNIKDTRVNLVFYKKGCPYCKAGKGEVIKQLRKSKVRTYFIDVETEKGINIARSYLKYKLFVEMKFSLLTMVCYNSRKGGVENYGLYN